MAQNVFIEAMNKRIWHTGTIYKKKQKKPPRYETLICVHWQLLSQDLLRYTNGSLVRLPDYFTSHSSVYKSCTFVSIGSLVRLPDYFT